MPSYFWMTAAIAGWVVLAHFLGLTPNRWFLAAFALVWLLWVATGFESNATNGLFKRFSVAGEVYNELSKTLLAIAYMLGALSPAARTPVLRIDVASSAAHPHHDAAHQHHIAE